MTTVSIVIPNYNHTRYVAGAIRSVLHQTHRSFEIIVVDDGSTDDCRDVVATFGDQVRYIWQENQGLAGARNTGILVAKGELIGLLDADDQWEPTFLTQMVCLAEQHPESAVYYCQARCMDSQGNELPQVLGGPVVPPAAMYDTVLRANFLIPSTILMRRAVVTAAGLFDHHLRSCEDWDLWLRLLPHYEFSGTNERLVLYRQHGDSLSANLDGMHEAARAVVKKHFGSDDGQFRLWVPKKRRAYGGLYRYYVLTSVLRQNNWEAAATWLNRALQADPTLAMDINLFYDLALGSQATGYRGTSMGLALDVNAHAMSRLLIDVFAPPNGDNVQSLRRNTYGTAYWAIGLAAYNTGHIGLSRSTLVRALYFRPDLWHDGLVVGDLVKSCLGKPLLDAVRTYRRQRVYRLGTRAAA